MKRFLIDTNILVYYFNGSFHPDTKEEIDFLLETSFIISVISKIEFLGWNKHTIDSFEKAKQFIAFAEVIHLSNKIIDYAISLKRSHRIKTPDALIAATTYELKATLVTRNVKDFDFIAGIDVYNPF